MQFNAYGTDGFNKIFNDASQLWDVLKEDKVLFKENIERNIRKICDQVAQTKLGITRWGCEGHPELIHKDGSNYDEGEGYIFIIAKDRDSSSKLLEILHYAYTDMAEEWGWDFTPLIEADVATIDSDNTYPVIIVRTPVLLTKTIRNTWWRSMTTSFKHHAKGYKSNANV